MQFQQASFGMSVIQWEEPMLTHYFPFLPELILSLKNIEIQKSD